MLRVSTAAKSTIVICDIDARRVDFAVANGFADKKFVVPRRGAKEIEEKLEIARETAGLAKEGAGLGEDFFGYDAVFECTGVEACMQTAIFVSIFEPFASYANYLTINPLHRPVDPAEKLS